MALLFNNYISRAYSIPTNGSTLATRLLGSPENSRLEKRFIVDFRPDIIEVPCVISSLWWYITKNTELKNLENTIYEFPLLYEHDAVHLFNIFKTYTPLLKQFFVDALNSSHLKKCKCKDTVYLGNKGFVMYEDGTPLIMLTSRCKKVYINGEFRRLTPINPVCRINPVIFSKDDPLAKYFRTTFITHLLTLEDVYNTIYRWNYTGSLVNAAEDSDHMSFSVIIENFDNMFDTSSVPDINCTNESINKFLMDNLEDFTKTSWT